MKGTHDGQHVVALVGRRHERAEVRLPVHAYCRRTLLLHALGDSSWRQQPGGGTVVTVAAVTWRETQAEGSC